MTVAHQPSAAMLGALFGVEVEEGGHLRLHRLGQQRPSAVAQLGQRIGKRDGSESFKTLLSVTAYHSFARYAALTLHAVTNFWP